MILYTSVIDTRQKENGIFWKGAPMVKSVNYGKICKRKLSDIICKYWYHLAKHPAFDSLSCIEKNT